MHTVKISVIIPTYKRAEDIYRAVDSVLNQTLKDIEVIVVDDNGIETEHGKRTAQAMLRYKDDNRVIYLQHEVNKNGSAARNTGILAAKGEYIAFLDDDDVYRPERLEKMCEKMDKLDSSWGACYTGYIKHQPDGTEQFSDEKVEGDVFVQALMRSLFIGTGSNLFFRRSVVDDIGLFDESFRRNQDLEYLVRVLKKYKLAYVDGFLVEKYHDIRTANITYEQSLEREKNFRDKFSPHLAELTPKNRREVEIMWDIDWIRILINRRMFIEILKAVKKARIPFKVWFSYAKYAFARKKNKTSYGFVVRL